MPLATNKQSSTMVDISDNKSDPNAGKATAMQSIEDALRRAHEIVPASASAFDFHLQVMELLSKTELPPLPAIEISQAPATPKGFSELTEPATNIDTKKPKMRLKRRREFGVFRKDVRMSVRGDAPISKQPATQAIEKPIVASARGIRMEQVDSKTNSGAEGKGEEAAIAALQAARYKAVTAGPKSTIVDSIPKHLEAKINGRKRRSPDVYGQQSKRSRK